jgi:hypothetical protein
MAVRIVVADFSISFFVWPEETDIRKSGSEEKASCAAIR